MAKKYDPVAAAEESKRIKEEAARELERRTKNAQGYKRISGLWEQAVSILPENQRPVTGYIPRSAEIHTFVGEHLANADRVHLIDKNPLLRVAMKTAPNSLKKQVDAARNTRNAQAESNVNKLMSLLCPAVYSN